MPPVNVLLIGRFGHPKYSGGVANATRNLLEQVVNHETTVHAISIRDSRLITPGVLDTAHYADERIRLFLLASTEGFGTRKSEMFHHSTEEIADRILRIGTGADFHVVHVITAYPNYVEVGRKVAQSLSLPYVVSARGSDVYGHNPEITYDSDKAWFLEPLRGASLVTVLSDFQHAEVRRNLEDAGLSHVPTRKIRNGVDTGQFAPLEKIGIPEGALRVAYTGRIKGFKRVIDIVTAVREAREHSANIELDVYGKPEKPEDDPIWKALWAYVHDNNLSSIVRLRGWVPHQYLPQVYQNHNVFVHASVCEGHSNSVMEAMSCGLAVLLDYESGSSDLLEDRQMEFTSGDVHGIANIFLRLATNPREIVEHGARNRAFALKHHWQFIADQYRKIYQELKDLQPGGKS